MATIDLKDKSGKTVGKVDLSDDVFAVEPNTHLLWEVVKWQRAKSRAGTHSAKLRSEVIGTSAKPYKQKGTGRARQGSQKSPIFVGGGVAHGPRPRDYSYELPKKARKVALRSALSLRAGEQAVVVLDKFAVEDGKTKSVSSVLKALGLDKKKALIVDGADNLGLTRGARNLPKSKWLATEGLNVYDVLSHDVLVLTQESVKNIESRLSKGAE